MRILLFAILLCPLAAIQAEEVSDLASNSRRSLRERNGPQRASLVIRQLDCSCSEAPASEHTALEAPASTCRYGGRSFRAVRSRAGALERGTVLGANSL